MNAFHVNYRRSALREVVALIDTLILDFDGVIIDTETPDYETWRDVFHYYGVKLELSLWSQYIGGDSGTFDAFQLLEDSTDKEVDRESVQRQRRQRYLEIVRASSLMPGVTDYIYKAKRTGMSLGIASSSSRSWVAGHLEERGILKYFDAITCKDDVSQVKPEPELYLRAAMRLETRPENAIAIEDSAKGITAAKRAGMYCVAVPNLVTKDLQVDHADYRLESLASMELGHLIASLEIP